MTESDKVFILIVIAELGAIFLLAKAMELA